MKISEHLDKNNLHHAYLIEGAREEIVPEIFEFFKSLGIKVFGNPDFVHIEIDNFKMNDAVYLRELGTKKGFSSDKKVFLICVNKFSKDAEGALLKIFEEPIENTHFFLVVPEIDALLPTLISRFYLIRTKPMLKNKEAEDFIKMPLSERLNFLKELSIKEEEETDISPDSSRSKAIKFLNALELVLHQKVMSKTVFDTHIFEQIFKVREFLRIPGSSTKSLLESVALVVPEKL